MEVKNSDLFMEYFVAIEMYLKDQLSNPGVGFSQMVQWSRKTNPIIDYYAVELIEFAQLRNAIVHNRVGKNVAIAEPHDEVVQSMKQILETLKKPKTIRDLGPFEKVYTAETKDLLSDVLKQQAKFNYSCVPVYDQQKHYVGLLHARLYQRLLEKNIYHSLDLATLSVGEVLKIYQGDDRVLFLESNASLIEIITQYQKLMEKGRGLIAMIFTENGQRNEKPLAILTIADMPKVFLELE